jgi:NAD(P)-dependent dehydrogenase (short-subunit alcohol dehydrogenase family)
MGRDMPAGFELRDSVVVVTGAGSGIGRALALRAAAGGARAVIICDVDDAGLSQNAEVIRSNGTATVRAVHLDVTDESAVVALVAQVEDELGPVDLWCSNAGAHRGHGLGENADWDLSLDLHVRAHVYVGRHVVPRMAARGRGAVLVTASAAGLLTDFASAPYAVSKHAAVALAEWLSIRYGTEGVQVSCLCPQGVKTAMNSDRRDGATGAGQNFLEADAVAAESLTGLAAGRFLILPHPEVATYEQRRAGDRDRWLAGMRRTSAALSATQVDLKEHTR